MIPNLAEQVRDLLLSSCCYGARARGRGSRERAWVRPEGTKVEQVTDTVLYVGTEVKSKSTADVENANAYNKQEGILL